MKQFALGLIIGASVMTVHSQAMAQEDPIDRDGRLMVQALKAGDLQRVKILLDRGYVDANGYTPSRGRGGPVYFLNVAADPNIPKLDGFNYLLDRGAREIRPACADDVYNGPIYFHIVGKQSFSARQKALERLIEYKIVDLNTQKYYADPQCAKKRPLAYLRPHDGIKLTEEARALWRFLLSNGMDVNLTDSRGWNTLHNLLWTPIPADVTYRLSYIAELKENGININARSPNGTLPIDAISLAPHQVDARCGDYLVHPETRRRLQDALLNIGSDPPRTNIPECPRGSDRYFCIPC